MIAGLNQQAEPSKLKRKRKAVQPSTRVLRRRKPLVATSSSDMQAQDSQDEAAASAKREPEVSSSMEGEGAGCSSARLTRSSTALQRLASLAMKM